jgi:hypothetical protein
VAPQPTKVEQYEAWWALVVRVLAFTLGALILTWQTVFEEQDRLWLIIAGVGLCGPVVAQSVATMFAALRVGRPPE